MEIFVVVIYDVYMEVLVESNSLISSAKYFMVRILIEFGVNSYGFFSNHPFLGFQFNLGLRNKLCLYKKKHQLFSSH